MDVARVRSVSKWFFTRAMENRFYGQEEIKELGVNGVASFEIQISLQIGRYYFGEDKVYLTLLRVEFAA